MIRRHIGRDREKPTGNRIGVHGRVESGAQRRGRVPLDDTRVERLMQQRLAVTTSAEIPRDHYASGRGDHGARVIAHEILMVLVNGRLIVERLSEWQDRCDHTKQAMISL